MKRTLFLTLISLAIVALTLAKCVQRGDAHQLQTTGAQQPAAAQTYRVPETQGKQLKQLVEAQDKLSQEYNRLEAQKVIVAQRAALELGLTAKQLDELELVVDSQGFFFRPVAKKPNPLETTNPKE